MPWLETEPMDQKVKFISAYLNNEESSFSDLCDRFNISRKTGYKYLRRYVEEGVIGLEDRSKAPHTQANRLPEHIEHSIIELKQKKLTWGAKKIYNWLNQEHGDTRWPARSTIEEVLKRHHLITPRKRQRRVPPYTQPFVLCEKPNDLWSIDYKGQFALGNKETCYPLTITDNFSRYVLAIKGSDAISGKQTKKTLEKLFHEYGLPQAVRSDNGSPFAGNGLGGLSRLSVWLIKLGIIPERIRIAHPEENGRHERMHFTLKQETASPPKFNQRQQQQCFDKFRKEFNEQRPHEGINFNRPAWLYGSSSRSYPKQISSIEYDVPSSQIRSVRTNGYIKWNGKEIFISEVLHGERVALKPHSEHEWVVYFSFLPIGILNEKVLKVDRL